MLTIKTSMRTAFESIQVGKDADIRKNITLGTIASQLRSRSGIRKVKPWSVLRVR